MIGRILYYSGRPQEVAYLLQMKKAFQHYKPIEKRLLTISETTTDRAFCYEALKKVSRSFSIVIQQLPASLRDPVCVFYLVLRGLDTIEDDMRLGWSKKEQLLRSFSEAINGPSFTMEAVGDKEDYRDLMLHFDKVCRFYRSLDPHYREVITTVTHQMAEGMVTYAHRTIVSYDDWSDYCHYVAGLVGIGLSQLFSASGWEQSALLDDRAISNEMGLFLQKTNILRDFAEDLQHDRIFWPEEAWKPYVTELVDLQRQPKIGIAVLNNIIVHTLQHIPACLTYLKHLQNKHIFRFCAIPQLMAVATLKELYGNEEVLRQNVKIRRGKTAKYFMAIHDFTAVKKEYLAILKQLEKNNLTETIHPLIESIHAL